MSNEEHVEEMYYFAHLSGVFSQFSEKITNAKKNTSNKSICEITEEVFDEFVKQGLIDTPHLFI
jgi:hypothetical protein